MTGQLAGTKVPATLLVTNSEANACESAVTLDGDSVTGLASRNQFITISCLRILNFLSSRDC